KSSAVTARSGLRGRPSGSAEQKAGHLRPGLLHLVRDAVRQLHRAALMGLPHRLKRSRLALKGRQELGPALIGGERPAHERLEIDGAAPCGYAFHDRHWGYSRARSTWTAWLLGTTRSTHAWSIGRSPPSVPRSGRSSWRLPKTQCVPCVPARCVRTSRPPKTS